MICHTTRVVDAELVVAAVVVGVAGVGTAQLTAPIRVCGWLALVPQPLWQNWMADMLSTGLCL